MIIDFVFKYEINMNLHRYFNSHYFYFVFPYFKFYKYFCQIIKLVFSLSSRFLFISAVNLSVFSFSVTTEMLFFQNLKLWQLTPPPIRYYSTKYLIRVRRPLFFGLREG